MLIAGATGLVLVAGGLWAGRFLRPAPLPPPVPVTASWLDFVPTAAQQKKMEALRASLNGEKRRFPVEERRASGNAQLFTYMAGTSTEDPVVEASLDAMPAAYGARSNKKPRPDRDVRRVLLKNLTSPSEARVLGALNAARVPLMMEKPDVELALAIAKLAESAPRGQRLLALEVLNLMRPAVRPPDVLAAFHRNLESDPAVAVAALIALAQGVPSLAGSGTLEAEIRRKVRELTRAEDPGVRGAALDFLAAPPADAEAAALAREHLGDPSPYVRSMAAASLGKVGAAGDVHALMKLTSDLEDGRLVVEGPPKSDGPPSRRQLGVPGWHVVAETALIAIQNLAARELPAPAPPAPSHVAFPALSIGYRRSGEAEVRESAAAVQRWYAAVKPSLPPTRH